MWSYSEDPASSDMDAVRFKIGDTDSDDELLQNEEIEYTLAEFATATDPVQRASIACARALEAMFARQSTYRIGQVSQTLSKKSDQFRRLAESLEEELVKRTPAEITGQPVLSSVKQADRDDSELIQPHFRVGIHDR